ncbi:MAG: VapE domain-containing protein, partial [Acutalibacteraceae bacterium]
MEVPNLTEEERLAFFDDILFRSSVLGIDGCAEYYSTGGEPDSATALDRKKDGSIRCTIKNYVLILSYDQYFMSLRYNTVAGQFEFHGEPWTDAAQSKALRYIEENYNGIKSATDFTHAMNIIAEEISYNPIYNRISDIDWDGIDRIEHFLSEIMGCKDSEYTRECSRLIFHGGISRLMNPGCKVDDVIILQGRQGSGKSTIVEMLAMQ